MLFCLSQYYSQQSLLLLFLSCSQQCEQVKQFEVMVGATTAGTKGTNEEADVDDTGSGRMKQRMVQYDPCQNMHSTRLPGAISHYQPLQIPMDFLYYLRHAQLHQGGNKRL